jgi:hypothetical protein
MSGRLVQSELFHRALVEVAKFPDMINRVVEIDSDEVRVYDTEARVVRSFENCPDCLLFEAVVGSGRSPESPSMPRGPQGQKRPADSFKRGVLIGKIATGEVTETQADDARLTVKLMEMSDLVAMIDATNPPKERGPYKKAA